jgi:DNA-binding SARP family transcriptional activator
MQPRRRTQQTYHTPRPVGKVTPEPVRIWLLDGFDVSVGSRTITPDAWRLKKAAALVKLLSLAPGHRMHREQAMDLLWPDSGGRAASNSLRSALHSARNVLDPAMRLRYLASEGGSLVLCPWGELWVDVDAFEQAVATARRSRDPAAYRAALELYRGELLPDDRYEEWAENRRQELHGAFVLLLIELAGLYEERGDYGRGVETLQRSLSVEPTNEEAHAGLMRLHALSGRGHEALSQYEQLSRALFGLSGTEPDVTTRRLRDEIAAGRFPPPLPSLTDSQQDGSSDLSRHNLPEPGTSFVDYRG